MLEFTNQAKLIKLLISYVTFYYNFNDLSGKIGSLTVQLSLPAVNWFLAFDKCKNLEWLYNTTNHNGSKLYKVYFFKFSR